MDEQVSASTSTSSHGKTVSCHGYSCSGQLIFLYFTVLDHFMKLERKEVESGTGVFRKNAQSRFLTFVF